MIVIFRSNLHWGFYIVIGNYSYSFNEDSPRMPGFLSHFSFKFRVDGIAHLLPLWRSPLRIQGLDLTAKFFLSSYCTFLVTADQFCLLFNLRIKLKLQNSECCWLRKGCFNAKNAFKLTSEKSKLEKSEAIFSSFLLIYFLTRSIKSSVVIKTHFELLISQQQ